MILLSAHRRPEKGAECPSLLLSAYSFGSKVFSKPEASVLSAWTQPVPISSSAYLRAGVMCMYSTFGLACGWWDMNSGPWDCAASVASPWAHSPPLWSRTALLFLVIHTGLIAHTIQDNANKIKQDALPQSHMSLYAEKQNKQTKWQRNPTENKSKTLCIKTKYLVKEWNIWV